MQSTVVWQFLDLMFDGFEVEDVRVGAHGFWGMGFQGFKKDDAGLLWAFLPGVDTAP